MVNAGTEKERRENRGDIFPVNCQFSGVGLWEEEQGTKCDPHRQGRVIDANCSQVRALFH